MCFILLGFQQFPDCPVAIGSNREERFSRAAASPAVSGSSPRVFCASDSVAGGTWLGINECGLFVAVTNRYDLDPPPFPRSRGLLCRDLLKLSSSCDAVEMSLAELASGRYSGVNVLIADMQQAWVVHGGPIRATIPLDPGFHFLTNGNVDDGEDARQVTGRQEIQRTPPATSEAFVEFAKSLCAKGPDSQGDGTIILRADDRGTVSSTIVLFGTAAASRRYLFSAGPPDLAPYVDLSKSIRQWPALR